MEPERRTNYDRRLSRRLVAPMRALALYLFVALAATVLIIRNDHQTNKTLETQCRSRQEARHQSNARNEVFRKEMLLTRKVWIRIAAVQTDQENKREALGIADEYTSLIDQVEDYKPIDCSEIR